MSTEMKIEIFDFVMYLHHHKITAFNDLFCALRAEYPHFSSKRVNHIARLAEFYFSDITKTEILQSL